ncbi:MAG: type VI secretion system baseplate subunit TssE [Novosphingobium sp.]|nr:type VI secretion system baseplate subunit TssE [Novosphingobium sp.]
MAEGPVRGRLNPTLFDKLVADNEISGARGAELEETESKREALNYFSVPQIERFNESALRATVRRELGWLLNTTCLGSAIDLDPYPEVKTSVLNYGVPDLAGKAIHLRLVLQRARDIRTAIRAFEPRFDASSLSVEVSDKVERENAVTFEIHGDVRSAVRAVPVKFRADIEADSAIATVRE